MDLTKAKSYQETVNQKQNGPKKASKDPLVAELEAKVQRLTSLVQSMADETREKNRQVGLLSQKLSEAVTGNQKLCSAIVWLKQRLAQSETQARKNSHVVNFFRDFLKPSAKAVCSHHFCQRFLVQVMDALKAEPAQASVPGDPSDLPVFESIRRNYSLFYTI